VAPHNGLGARSAPKRHWRTSQGLCRDIKGGAGGALGWFGHSSRNRCSSRCRRSRSACRPDEAQRHAVGMRPRLQGAAGKLVPVTDDVFSPARRWPLGVARAPRATRRPGSERPLVLCRGPLVDEPAIGVGRLRISLDALPVKVPAFARAVPSQLLLPVFASLIPQMIVPYADAAALMLAPTSKAVTPCRAIALGWRCPWACADESRCGRPKSITQ
jgi:hypothetical protein